MELPAILTDLKPDSILVFQDSALRRDHCDRMIKEIARQFHGCNIEAMELVGGEETKSIQSIERIWQQFQASNLTRSSLVFAAGGGTIMDAVGFAASTFKRGMNWVAVPTTLLGMVDAAWGGKTGINWGGIKNTIGSFHLPLTVWSEGDWLETLPEIEIWNGWMEMAKHGLIHGGKVWLDLVSIDRPTTIAKRDLHAQSVISAELKQSVVAKDPQESGRRKVLNFGHTMAHSLEALSHVTADKRPIPHGIAVGWGMCYSLEVSMNRLGTNHSEMSDAVERIRFWLEEAGVGKKPSFSTEAIWAKMIQDKKNRKDQVLEVLLDAVGLPRWDVPVDRSEFVRIWDRLH